MNESSVAREQEARKKAFRIALAHAEMTASQFAALNEVSPQAVSQVISGADTSERLLKAIDEFIAKHAPEEAA